MKKKVIYITEKIASDLYDYQIAPLTSLPSDIRNAVNKHKTSLGLHPAFPPEEEISFDVLVTQKSFDEVRQHALDLNLKDYSPKEINKYLQTIINECKEIEKGFKTQLENICYNYIIDLFNVPEGLVSFKCSIVENVNIDKALSKNNNAIDFENIKHRKRLHDAVYKRRIINAIITGGAKRLSFIDKKLIGELYELSPELPKLYKQITSLNDYLLFTKNDNITSEKKKKLAGISYLTIGNETTKNKVVAEGEIFPVLLYESVRGFLEMFAAYGLPSSKQECSYVLSKADFIDAEQWDIRLGPVLWDYIFSIFKYPKSTELPLILTTLFSQSCDKFNYILQEIFGETKHAKTIVQKIIDKINDDIDFDEFEDQMKKKQTEYSIIQDNNITSENL